MFSIGSFSSQMVIQLCLCPKTFLILFKMVPSAYFSNTFAMFFFSNICIYHFIYMACSLLRTVLKWSLHRCGCRSAHPSWVLGPFEYSDTLTDAFICIYTRFCTLKTLWPAKVNYELYSVFHSLIRINQKDWNSLTGHSPYTISERTNTSWFLNTNSLNKNDVEMAVLFSWTFTLGIFLHFYYQSSPHFSS